MGVKQDDFARRPHFHFSRSPWRIPESHLVSTLATPVEGQVSVEYLERLLDDVVEVFQREVLGLLADNLPLAPIL